MEQKYTFSEFFKNAWWLMLVAFGHAFNNADGLISDSIFVNVLFSAGFIFVILYIYWFIRYGNK